MPRAIVLGNGRLMVACDRFGRMRDLFYPRVGLEDHVRGHYMHRTGVWVDGQMSWIGEDQNWQVEVMCEDESLVSHVTAHNPTLGITVASIDLVYNEQDVFLRKITVTNHQKRSREIKLYIAHQFEIFKSHAGETAYFDPVRHSIIHYKGQRVFLMNGDCEGSPFTDYTIGLANFEGKEGSHRDADDGVLSKNPIEHGPVDSIIGFYSFYSGEESKTTRYWVCASKSIADAIKLNDTVMKKTPDHMMKTTTDYWKAWVNKYQFSFHQLTASHIAVFNKSLLYIRAHVDNDGGIIASADSDMLQHGKDTYSYVWPRDAAYTALALDRAGDQNVARRFFEFCNDTITEGGYFMHKYLPDKSLGSSWHPWIRDGKFQLPIQEDETALVIYALYQHYKHSRDLEFVESVYNSLIEKAADFMVAYRDKMTKLPKGSYDLWEEKYGTSTFTASAVYGALIAAADFSKLLGKFAHEAHYRTTAEEIKVGILQHLYSAEENMFVKMISLQDGKIVVDKTLDASSVYGVFHFGVLPVTDPRLVGAMEKTFDRLSKGVVVGGLARYEGDGYFRAEGSGVSNPWFITTLWYVQYLIARAQTEKDFDAIREWFTWVARYAGPSGVLSEQIDPYTGAPLSASPLTWSHAEVVNTWVKYLNRLEELGYCKACNPVP